MELTVKETIKIEEGKHTGKITKIEERTEPFHYADIYIQPNGQEFEIKYGCPANISENTKLGKLIKRFVQLKVGEKLKIEEILIGKKVSFITINEEKNGNTYVKIADDSVKPIEESP